MNLACVGMLATSWAVVTVPATGVVCTTALVVTTPISLVEGIKGSKLLTGEQISTFERAVDIGSGALVIGGSTAKVFLTIGKDAKTGAKLIILTSDGTTAGEQALTASEISSVRR